MQLSVMRDRIQTSIYDSSYSSDAIDGFINEAYMLVAGRVVLPTLKAVSVVETVEGQAYTAMTDLTGGFAGKLLRVSSGSGLVVEMLPNIEALMDAYSDFDAAGAVEAVALEGSTLWYQKIPAAAETLTVVYYKNPTELSSDSDEPVVLPSYLHEKLLVNAVAFRIYHEIEQASSEDKTSSLFHKGLFEEGMQELQAWVARNRRGYVSSVWKV